MPAQHSGDALNNDSNIEINERHNMLFKLYATLLTNNTVQVFYCSFSSPNRLIEWA